MGLAYNRTLWHWQASIAPETQNYHVRLYRLHELEGKFIVRDLGGWSSRNKGRVGDWRWGMEIEGGGEVGDMGRKVLTPHFLLTEKW